MANKAKLYVASRREHPHFTALQDSLGYDSEDYIDSAPDSDPLNDQNMPGHIAEQSVTTDMDEETAELDFARFEWQKEDIYVTPPTNKDFRSYSNVPIIRICSTSLVQPAYDKNFAYITQTAARLSKFQ